MALAAASTLLPFARWQADRRNGGPSRRHGKRFDRVCEGPRQLGVRREGGDAAQEPV